MQSAEGLIRCGIGEYTAAACEVETIGAEGLVGNVLSGLVMVVRASKAVAFMRTFHRQSLPPVPAGIGSCLRSHCNSVTGLVARIRLRKLSSVLVAGAGHLGVAGFKDGANRVQPHRPFIREGSVPYYQLEIPMNKVLPDPPRPAKTAPLQQRIDHELPPRFTRQRRPERRRCPLTRICSTALQPPRWIVGKLWIIRAAKIMAGDLRRVTGLRWTAPSSA